MCLELSQFQFELLQVNILGSKSKFYYKIQTLRDCLKSIQNEDYCLSLLATPSTSNTAGRRIKRTPSPIIEKSFLREVQTRNHVCQLPCQRRPLLVDKKKILGYLGFGHIVKQLNGLGLTDLNITCDMYMLCYSLKIEIHWLNQNQDTNNSIDIGQCDGNCRSSQYSTFTVSKILFRESEKFSIFGKRKHISIQR